jgi:hypothetical protein
MEEVPLKVDRLARLRLRLKGPADPDPPVCATDIKTIHL